MISRRDVLRVGGGAGFLAATTGWVGACAPETVPGALDAGLLEVMTDVAGVFGWAEVPDPSAAVTSTRHQVADMRTFGGGEGVCALGTDVFFTTKYDNRVWRYDTAANDLSVRYDAATSPTPVLSGVDNITVTDLGDLVVAEDGDDMQLVLLSGTMVEAIAQVTVGGESEITGPSFHPDGTRLYFSSQRNPGATFEITGPFRLS